MSAQNRIARDQDNLRSALLGRRVVDVEWVDVDEHEQVVLHLDDGSRVVLRSQPDVHKATWLRLTIGTPIPE